MPTEEKMMEVGAFRWFYREATPIGASDQTPVLLLHGLVSQSYSWRNVLSELSDQGLRAIAPDWIGAGFSAKPDRRAFAYTPEAFIQALAELVQALSLDRCSLVTQGFLGSVGLQYALRYPETIERLAILNTPLSTTVQLPWKIRQLGLPLAGEMFTQDPLLVDRTLEGGGPYQVADADLDVYRRPFLRSSDAGRSLFVTIRNLQLRSAMMEIETGFTQWQKPTLVAWGVDDPWLPVTLARNFVASLPAAELVEMEEVGHYAQEDWHEKVSQALLPFLRRRIIS